MGFRRRAYVVAQRWPRRGDVSPRARSPCCSPAAVVRIRLYCDRRPRAHPARRDARMLRDCPVAQMVRAGPSDRDVSKLKQVAPVVAGQQQSVGAVALRATAEQDQLRSAAWDEQPRALSLRSLRNPPTGGSPLSENLCFGAAKVTSLSWASCREVATEPAALIVVTLGCSSLGLFLTDCIPVGWSSLGFGCFRRGIGAEVWPRQCSGLTLGIGPSRSNSEGRGRRAHRKCGAALEDPGNDGGTCAFFAYS